MALIITTRRLWLCTLDESDAALVLAYYKKNQDHFRQAMPAYSRAFFTERFHYKTLYQQKNEMKEQRLFKFWIFLRDEGDQIIGDASLSNIVRGPLQAAFLGYKLDSSFEGMGYMREALEAIITFGFSTLHLHRIEANIMPANRRSLRLIRSLGFHRDGYTESYLKIDGSWQGHYRYSIINPADL